MNGKKEMMRKPPITASHRGMGMGMGNMNTLSLGLIIVRAPPRAKIAPEAPTAGMLEPSSKSIYKILPSIPPPK